MKLIPLTRGLFAKVDDEDFDRISSHRWYASSPPFMYAARRKFDGKPGLLFMHTMILGVMPVDHINGDGLDNRRENLRACTGAQNTRNSAPQKGRSSRYKGVSWSKQARRWMATITGNGKRYYLGSYVDEAQAARVYDKKAKELHAEFARLNNAPVEPYVKTYKDLGRTPLTTLFSVRY